MKTMILGLALISSAAWAQGAMGCNKDIDCKGDRICVSGQCVSASQATPQQPEAAQPAYPAQQQQPQQYPQQQYPAQQQYPPQQYPPAQQYPAQQYPPQQPQPYYPPEQQPPPYYQPRYRAGPVSPLILGVSGMVGVTHETYSDAYGVEAEVFAEVGIRLTPSTGLVAWGDLNAATYAASTINGTATTVNTTGGAVGAGLRFGQYSAVTLGVGPAFAKSDYFTDAFGGVTFLGHLTVPLAGAFSLHAQAAYTFFPNGPFGGNFSSEAVYIGLGFAR